MQINSQGERMKEIEIFVSKSGLTRNLLDSRKRLGREGNNL